MLHKPQAIFQFLALAMMLCPSLGWAQSTTAGIEIRGFQKILDSSPYPALEKIHYNVLEETRHPGDDTFMVVTNFRSFAYDAGEDENGDTIVKNQHFCQYSIPASNNPRTNRESGYFSFEVTDLDETDDDSPQPVTGSSVAGFIRRPSRFTEQASEPENSFLANASGTIAWERFTGRRDAVVEMTHTVEGVQENWESDVTLTAEDNEITITGLKLRLSTAPDLLSWSFSSVTLNRETDWLYADVVRRTDGYDAEDIAGSGFTFDPADFWQRTYLLLITDYADRDKDGTTDIMDFTITPTAFPWYADGGTSDNWYRVDWMQTWVHSSRASDWDYNQLLGWTYVPITSNRFDFWIYCTASQLGWLWTTEDTFPEIFRSSDGTWGTLSRNAQGSLILTNTETGEEEVINL